MVFGSIQQNAEGEIWEAFNSIADLKHIRKTSGGAGLHPGGHVVVYQRIAIPFGNLVAEGCNVLQRYRKNLCIIVSRPDECVYILRVSRTWRSHRAVQADHAAFVRSFREEKGVIGQENR